MRLFLVSDIRSWLVGLALALIAIPSAPAWAGKTTCLTGTNPEVAGDLAAINALRAQIEAACVCADFDGTAGKKTGDYKRCVKLKLLEAVAFDDLRRQCRSVVSKVYRATTCGRAPTPTNPRVACVERREKSGRVKCKIKTESKCTSTSSVTRAICSDFDICIDAADSNGDALIDESDFGTCVSALLPPLIDDPVTLTTDPNVELSGTSVFASTIEVRAPSGDLTVAVVDGSFSVNVPLEPNRNNPIFLTAVSPSGERSAPLALDIIQDQQAPDLFIDFPTDGATVSTATTDVAGRIGDLLSGFMGLAVTVNGVPATIDIGIGTNGTFFLSNVPLSLGVPTLVEAIATDELGNQATQQISVTRVAVGPGETELIAVSGNTQSAEVKSFVPSPAIVRLVDEVGTPLAGETVSIRVVRSDGVLATDPNSNVTTRLIDLVTDSNGEAQVHWRLGSDAGSGNNRLEVQAVSAVAPVFFCASGLAAPATQIAIGTGLRQEGEVGALLPEPLVAWVHDSRNPVADVPVTFRVIEGGGRVGDETEITLNTDATGHAEISWLLGPIAGIHEVEADFPNNPGLPVFFTAFARSRDPNDPTSFSGQVFDNANRPLENATVQLDVGSTSLVTTTASDGRFEFPSIPESGAGGLTVDGSMSTSVGGEAIPAGSFPELHYEIVLIPNTANELGFPIPLPPLEVVNERIYDGTQDVELEIEGIAGLKMTVRAGSVTLANGSIPDPNAPATLSLNQVHFDDVPMPLPDGAAAPFAWTLQPAGTRFDPPVEIQFPNLSGLAPGEAMYFLSFNHDTGDFEIVATGTVTENGAFMVTDPDSGITTAGWGAACPPYPNLGDLIGAIAGFFATGDFGPINEPPVPNNDPNNPETTESPSVDLTQEFAEMWEDWSDWIVDITDDIADWWSEGERSDQRGDPVIMSTGEFILTEIDLRIPGRGFDFRMQRTYRSQYNADGPLGHNWDFNYNERLFVPDPNDTDQDVMRCSGRSRVDRYEDQPGLIYGSPDGFYDELIKNPDDSFTIRDRSGFKKHFDPNGFLTAHVDRYGNTMTFSYDALGFLQTVTDTLGRDIEFRFGQNRRLESVTDYTGREVRYTYDDNGDLIFVRTPVVVNTSTGNDFPNGKTTFYEYSSGLEQPGDPRTRFLDHNMISITDPKAQRYLVNNYGQDPNSYEFDRIVVQQFGEAGQNFTYQYSELNPGLPETPALPRNQTIETDRNGNRTVLIHNALGNLLEKRVETNRNVNPDDPAVFITQHTYNDDGERTSTTRPEGNQIDFVYDTGNTDRLQQGNLIEFTRTPGPRGAAQDQLKLTYAYEPIYNRVASRVDRRGNDPNYQPQNGGGQSATRYTKTNIFDYQEGDNLTALALETGRSEVALTALLAANGVALDLGDLNGDGISNQIGGNIVREVQPTVNLLASSAQAVVEGDTTQEIISEYTYNRFGQKTAVIDAEGNVDDYVYYPENDPDGDTFPSFSTRTLAVDTGGYLAASIRDNRTSPRRRSTAPLTQIRMESLYDPVGNLVRSTDGRGNVTVFEVNELNQIVRTTLEAPFNYETAFVYDLNDNVIEAQVQNVDTNGPNLGGFVTTRFNYDILDNPLTKSEEVSSLEFLITQFAYDGNENRIRITQPEGNIVETVYDERDLVFSITRGAGTAETSTNTHTYDGNENLIRAVDAEDNNGDAQNEENLAFYDGYDRRIRTVDAVGNEMDYGYDPESNLVLERHLGLNGGASQSDNSTASNVLLSQVEFAYDELNRSFQRDDLLFSNVAVVGPEGPLSPGDGRVTTHTEYDRLSRMTRVLDDNIHQRLREHDGVDRVIREVDELQNEVLLAYDDNHNLVQTTEIEKSPEAHVPDETFVTQREYDEIDRVAAIIDNLGNRTTYQYDSRNNRIQSVDALGNTISTTYDGINRLLAEVRDLRVGGTGAGSLDPNNPSNADGQITVLSEWDQNSRLLALIDDGGNRTEYEYDALNRRTIERFADLTTNTFIYDRDSNIRQLIDENGSVHTNTFDGINRLIAKDLARAPDIEGTTEWRYEYDGLSRSTRATDNNDPNSAADNSDVDLRYDSLSRTLAEIQNGKTVATEFDGVGNRLSCTYPDGRILETRYDGLDRVEQIGNQGSPGFIAEYDYLGPSRTLERRYGNGTRLRYHDGAGQDVGYDGIKRTLQLRHEQTAGSLVAGFQYAYDKRHNRRFELDLFVNTADVYEYDSDYRVTRAAFREPAASVASVLNNDNTNADVSAFLGETENVYRLDGIGNWAERTQASATTTFTANNMNEYAQISAAAQTHDDNGNLTNDANQTYVYDFANRLLRIESSGSITIATYTYDALGRRIQKMAGVEITNFYYDGARSIEERDGLDATVRQYVFGRGIDEVLEITTGGNAYHYHENSIGSIAALSDPNGAIVERIRYDIYGEPEFRSTDGLSSLPSSTIGNPFLFTGRRLDSESSLYYYRARYYDPARGRFLQRDPLGYVDGMGLYGYVSNNPVNFVDPMGREKGGDQWQTASDIADAYDAWAERVKQWLEKEVVDPYGTAGVYGATAGATAVDFVGGIIDVARLGEGAAEGTVIGVAIDILRVTAVVAPMVKGFGAVGSGTRGVSTSSISPASLTKSQAAKYKRFEKKLPKAQTGVDIDDFGDGVLFTAEVPASNVPGSKAVYQKAVDANGVTTAYTKTTFDPYGNIVHVKDKIIAGK